MALQEALDEAEAAQKRDRAKKTARERVLRQWLPDMKADTPRLRDPAQENPEGIRR